MGGRSRMTKATSASGSAAGGSSAVAVPPPGADSASRRCGLNGGILAERSLTRQRQIAGDAHEGTHAHDFMIADPRHGGDADHLAGEGWLFRGRQPVALARDAEPVGADAERAAQRDFDPFGQ